MQAHPEIGILQQLIVGLPNPSPFPRIFQFGMRHGMRAYMVGSAWWQGDCGPYWGHNAVIRVAPFIAHCRLPVLPGGPPLGGRVLSHDQVEAVLMRCAGWQVRALVEEAGSYEENPPTLSDFVKRDLRWCQGNWQYLRLIGRPGLHWMGRLQLWLAILMYVSGPAWILFSLVAFGCALAPRFHAPSDPIMGLPMSWEPWALLAATMTLVLAPKLAGIAQVLLVARLRRVYGGGLRVAISTLVELSFSFVLAPIMAVGQSIFLLGMLAGRTIRWEAQRRDPRSLGWGEAFRGLWPQTLLGLVLCVTVWAYAPESVRLWAILFCGPLLLAVPFAVITSWVSLGRLLSRLGICAVPEEVDPPRVVVAAGHAVGWPSPPDLGGGRLGAAEVPRRAGRGLTGSSVRPAKADVGCGRVDAAIDRTPAQLSVEGEGSRVVDQALQNQRPVDLGPRRRQEPAADAAAAPRGRHMQEMHEGLGAPKRQEASDLLADVGDEQFLAVHLLGEVAIPPRWVAWLDLLLRAREQRGARRQVALERRAHREGRAAAHSPGTSSGAE
jgi:membrane glycosyltransferase